MKALLVILVTFLTLSPVEAQYSGGSGTAENPYQIATAQDLILLSETPDDYDEHFILTADIDLDPNRPSGKVFYKAVIAPDTDDANPWRFDEFYETELMYSAKSFTRTYQSFPFLCALS